MRLSLPYGPLRLDRKDKPPRGFDPRESGNEMGVPAPAVYLPVTVEVPGYGKLSLSPQPNAPLLMVFGGIDVAESVIDPADKAHAKDMIQSGVYMWKYFNNLKSRYHIFVAHNPKVNGALAYRYVLFTLQWKGFPPAVCPVKEPDPFSGPSQVLYLFSGGYKPGIELLKNYPLKLFSTICLVDIWMGSKSIGSYYENLAAANAGKTYYIHTSFGANNDAARDSIARSLGSSRSKLVKGKPGESGMQTHMRTNEEATSRLVLP